MSSFFFLGIKGAGMAALACILKDLGHTVEGSDIDKHLFTEESLHDHKIKIHPFSTLPHPDQIIIVGNAFSEDFEDLKKIRELHPNAIYRYHEYLGELMKHYVSIGISGSHGKTTSTKMMTSILSKSRKTGYLIGDGHGHLSLDDAYFVVEADEYRRFFHAYHPKYALITNVDYDHVDYFKSEEDYRLAYEDYSANVTEALMVFGDDPKVKSLNFKQKVYTYGLNGDNDLVGKIIHENKNETLLELHFHGKFVGQLRLPFSGRHLVWNALGCSGIALLEGLNLNEIQLGISSFKNAARRFVVEELNENVYIDDYAHHPTEVSVTIDAARLRYPNHTLVAIFKPHRVSRLYHFAQEFADALDKADAVYLCGFSAIDDQEEGYDITIDYLKDKSKKAIVITEDERGAAVLAQHQAAVFLFMSSKDIYVLSDLLKRYQNS